MSLVAFSFGAETAYAQGSKLVLEPKAIELLKAASNRPAAAHTMSFTTVVTEESPSRLGIPLAYTTKSEVVMQRPDKLRVITLGDGPASEFYYDGKIMMAYAPAEDLVAIADAPPTIDETMEVAYHVAAIYFPFDDVIVSDPYKDLAGNLDGRNRGDHSCWLHDSQRAGHNLLSLRQHTVQPVLRRERRLLPRGAHSLSQTGPHRLGA
jgi:hypothetical protein